MYGLVFDMIFKVVLIFFVFIVVFVMFGKFIISG